MSFLAGPELEGFEGGVDDLLTLFGIAHGESEDKAIKELGQEANALAVFTVKAVIALFWWAAHIGSATADAFGYAAQIQAALAEANRYNLEAWQKWTKATHPENIANVFLRTTREVHITRKIIETKQKVNLKPIKREIAELEKWKKRTATPELHGWMTFDAQWRKHYAGPVRTLADWLKSPGSFARWAAPPILSWEASNLHKSRYQHSLTSIAALSVATWARDPDRIYDGILEWLVTG